MKSLLSLLGRMVVTLVVVGAAAFVGWQLWVYYMDEPWTRDGRVLADVVGVAPDVSGLVDAVPIKDNQAVKKGDVLFRIDQARFTLALAQAEAVLTGRQAALELASSIENRYKQLSDTEVTREKLDQVLESLQQAQADMRQATTNRDVAKLDLARSEVRASVDGIVTNMSLLPGAYVSAGKPVMALVATETLHVEGYFEETKLPRIHIGDPVAIHLMGESTVLRGHVDSVAAGIEDRERGSSSNLLANINPSFTWVRLAQRVPVRVALDKLPAGTALVAGRTATVVIEPGGNRAEAVR